MGTTMSGDTRRISFDNMSCNASAAVVAEKCFLSEENLPLSMIAKQVEDDSAEIDLYINKKARQAAAAGDDYWLNRVQNLQKAHQEINKIIDQEYEKTVESTNKLLPKPQFDEIRLKKASQLYDLQNKVMKCYQDNPHQSLKCSSIVKTFYECVAAGRNE